MSGFSLAQPLKAEERMQWLGWALIFSCFYILPRNIQNASFYIGLTVVLLEKRHFLLKIIIEQKLIGIACYVMAIVTITQTLAGITSPAAALETMGSIVTIYLFVLALGSIRSDRRRFLLMVAVFALIGALIGWYVTAFLNVDNVQFRWSGLGKARNPIQAGALLAFGIFALASIKLVERWQHITRAATILFLSMTLLATFSRGPIISFVIALFSYVILRQVPAKYVGKALIPTLCFGWLSVVTLVLGGEVLENAMCILTKFLCRSSERQDIWMLVWKKILEHPILGNGMDYRFSDPFKSHAHNGVFGMIFNFGIIGLLAFLALIVLILKKRRSSQMERVNVMSLVFAFSYMGSDLASPFGFIGAHYLILWLPLVWWESPTHDLSSQKI